MAIATKSLSQLIAEFRKLQTKNSITTESLDYILQRIADILATAGTSETQAILGNWYNALSKVSHTAVCTCEVQTGDEKLNTVKFTWRYTDNRPIVRLSASPGIFTSPYNIVYS